MKLTKYEHACFTLEKDDQVLVVDPGGLATDFIAPENVVAIVVTHDHFDHFDHDQLASIVDKNPEAVILGPGAVTSKIETFTTRPIKAGDTVTIDPFELRFTGGAHALIHTTIPRSTNVGVIINELVYYPGDSFTLPGMSIDTLALPTDAPWMKIGEAMDFLTTVKPRLAFSTHDALLSDAGKMVADTHLQMAAKQAGIEYRRLTDPIEI